MLAIPPTCLGRTNNGPLFFSSVFGICGYSEIKEFLLGLSLFACVRQWRTKLLNSFSVVWIMLMSQELGGFLWDGLNRNLCGQS